MNYRECMNSLKRIFYLINLEPASYRDRRVEKRGIQIYITHLASLMSTIVSYFKGTKSERGSVAKRLNNASGQRLCLSTLLSL